MDRRIKKAIEIILQDTQHQLRTRDVAQRVNLSRGRFNLLFYAETSLTPGECARYWRLRQAKELLDQSFLKVTEVAATLGFRHVSSFSREFKKVYGYPPSASYGKAEKVDSCPAKKRVASLGSRRRRKSSELIIQVNERE